MYPGLENVLRRLKLEKTHLGKFGADSFCDACLQRLCVADSCVPEATFHLLDVCTKTVDVDLEDFILVLDLLVSRYLVGQLLLGRRQVIAHLVDVFFFVRGRRKAVSLIRVDLLLIFACYLAPKFFQT